MAKMSKKERESSIRFSKIKSWFKKKGFDVSSVKKSQNTYSSNERIRKDILKQLGIDAKISKFGKLFYDKAQFSEKLKESYSIKEGKELADNLQSAFGRTFNTKSTAKTQATTNNQTSATVKDPIVPYTVLKKLPRAREEDEDGYPMIYNFYSALGLDINNAESETVRKSDIESIDDAEIRNWALRAFQDEYTEDIAEANKED